MKHKKLLTVAIAIVLLICFPISTVALEVEFGQEYWQTVADGSCLYHTNYPLLNNLDDTYGILLFPDYYGLTASELRTFVTYGQNSSVTLPNGNSSKVVYAFLLPLAIPSTESYTTTLDFTVMISDTKEFTLYETGDTVYSTSPGNDMLHMQGVFYPDSAYSFVVKGRERATTSGSTTTKLIDSSMITVSDLYSITYADVWYPPYWYDPETYDTISCVDISIKYSALTNVDILAVELYTNAATYASPTDTQISNAINPQVMFAIRPSNFDGITGNDETLVAIHEISVKMDELLNPDAEIESELEKQESVYESLRDQFDDAMSEIQDIMLPEHLESFLDNVYGPSGNPYDDDWLNSVFGGLWANKFILQMMIISIGFALTGFVLYGKR